MPEIPCKICHTPARLHGPVDRFKSCESAHGRYFPLSGQAVWYYRCPSCGFLFTPDFDDWSREDWLREIYNERYGEVDPDQADGSRARSNAVLVRSRTHADHRILDYGGGDGTMARELVRLGRAASSSWDPILDGPDLKPEASFDIVTAFEVFEHSTTPIETAREAVSFLAPKGALVFSTLVCDALPMQAVDWFYVAPFNGHVSIHTLASLKHMLDGIGWKVGHISQNLHVAQKA